jgi:hypothetical protein
VTDERRKTFSLADLNRRLTPSAVALILANLIPLYGVALLGWRVFPVVLLFWFENVVVGFYNALKIGFARPGDVGRWIAKVFMIPFFLFHYGMFTFVHGIFVLALFGSGIVDMDGGPSVAWFRSALVAAGVTWAAVALFVSHGFSFAHNYIARGEYRRATLENLMKQPYSRVVVLHVVIIASGFLVMALGAPVLGLVLLVLLKTGVDVSAHLKERDKFATPNSLPPAGSS